MKILLQETLRHKSLKLDGATRAYVTRMLAVFDNPENRQRSVRTSVSSSEALAEPLSEREIEILRLLVEGLSNREIARRLYISAGTVKVHLKHIYAKLDVSNRMEATARAHQLDLV